jgi:hypothetical protein
MLRNTKRLCAIVAGLVLAFAGACSDQPSRSQIKKAVQEQMDSPMGKAINGGDVTVEDVSNLNCVQAAGKPGYICSYDVVIVHKKGGRRDVGPAEARFVKSSGGWAVAQQR